MKKIALVMAVLCMLMLGVTGLAAACSICGGDGICDVCGGTGYISSLQKNCVCNYGRCPICSTTSYSSSSRTFELNSRLSGYGGRYTVSWTDSKNAGPYEVGRTYSSRSGSATQGYFYANSGPSDSTTYGNSLTIDYLIPGETYIIDVIDGNGTKIQRTYTIPFADSFVDGKLKASSVDITIKPSKYNSYTGKIVNISELRANEIESGIDNGDAFGLNYRIDFPRLATDREFFTQVAFFAPNGFCHTEYADSTSFSSFSNASGSYFYWNILGQNFFNNLYDKNGYVPTGEYRVELYWDGMHVDTSTFRVR